MCPELEYYILIIWSPGRNAWALIIDKVKSIEAFKNPKIEA
jgi:hypothetical protein